MTETVEGARYITPSFHYQSHAPYLTIPTLMARRIEEQVMLSNSKLEKVLLENGSQVTD